jgi:hypothetical protein
MGSDRVVFESAGQRTEHLIPGVYTRNNYEKQSGGGVSANNAVILGESKGGEPKRLVYFSSPAEARAMLIDGIGLKGVLHAFDPGSGYTPQRIGFMRVNVGTRSSSVMKNGGYNVIDLEAWDWGLHGNQVKRKLTDGTVSGTHKLSIQYGTNTPEEFDNIEKQSLSVQYTGTGAAASMAVSGTGIVVTVDAAEALNVPFASFPTIDDIVNYINDQADFQAVLLTGDGSELASQLDHYAGADIKASAFVVKSDLQAIIDTFKRSSYIGKAEYPSNGTVRKVPTNDAAWVYFTGGANGTADATAYANALVELESENVQIIATTSTDAAIHVLIQDHCKRMASVEGKRERQAWVGGATGETVDATIVRSKQLNSELVNLAYPSFKQYNLINTGLGVEDCSPALYACKLLGLEASVAVNEPVTNKEMAVLSWGKTLTKTEIEKLIQAGVTVGAKSDDGNLVTVRGVTTFQGSLLQKNERSMVRESLYISRDFRAAFRGDVGRPQTAVDAGTAKSVLISKGKEWNNLGLIVKGADKDLIWGIVISENGDAVMVSYHTYLTAPRNFIFGTANLHVLTQTVAI